MKSKLAAVAAALAFGASGAWASATATMTINGTAYSGGQNFQYYGDDYGTASFYFLPFPSLVPAGQTVTFSWDYTITLHNDGLAITSPIFNICSSLHTPTCGPYFNGFEQAQAIINLAVDGRYGSEYDIGLSYSPVGCLAAAGQDITCSGVFKVAETNYDTFTTRGTGALVALNMWTMSSTAAAPAVPEPANVALLLAGLALIGGRFASRRS